MLPLLRYCLWLLFAAGAFLLEAQTPRDSTRLSLKLLAELAEAGNYEQAQLESEQFLAYLHQSKQLCPPEAVPLLSGIYAHNQDKNSAMAFFSRAAGDARRDPDPEGRVKRLEGVIAAYSQWEAFADALKCQQELQVAKDSLAERERQLAIGLLQGKIDSLAKRQHSEAKEQAEYLQVQPRYAYLLAGAAVLFFFALLLLNWRTAARWRKRLDKKIRENDFLRSERFTSTLTVDPALIAVPEQETAAYEKQNPLWPGGHRPDKKALLIEPNRQIVLYIKSLLSDRFEVETAGTPSEGLQVASNQMPDLIVCDTVLNGQTGIDVVRQIKLSERTNHIPVILLTDRFGNEGKLDALRAGADAWFNRPVLDDEFDASVNRLLDLRREQHENFSRFLHLYFSENRIALRDTFLAKTIQAIDENLSDPDFMADDLARKMQLHKQHFFKKIQALTGKEPVQLIRELRLEKARALLEKRAGTPQAIAELVGFSSAGTFSLAFKEYFGENTLLLQLPDKA